MFGLLKKSEALQKERGAAVEARTAYPQSTKLQTTGVDAKEDAYLQEYASLADTIGVKPPDMEIERFRNVLVKLDLPIYSLAEVIRYMDEKAAQESKGRCGWEWRPLREADSTALYGQRFGTPADRRWRDGGEIVTTAASDHFAGPHRGIIQGRQGDLREGDLPASSRPYDRTIPLHALRRVALIEKAYDGPKGFLVTDYALAPQIRYPDPFLMVVIPNPNVGRGDGRFVIDFWDEPGFGIEQMLKA